MSMMETWLYNNRPNKPKEPEEYSNKALMCLILSIIIACLIAVIKTN